MVSIEVHLGITKRREKLHSTTYLESLVLENSLDGSVFIGWRELCLEDNTERSISHDFTLCIL